MKILTIVLLFSLAGCVLAPRLPPVEPPPNPVPGLLLVDLTQIGNAVEHLRQPTVVKHRDSQIPHLYRVDPERARRILAHQVVVGMTSQEVVWSFQAHPTRIEDQGSPGGHTLLWEPDRVWVRLDSDGMAISAGRY